MSHFFWGKGLLLFLCSSQHCWTGHPHTVAVPGWPHDAREGSWPSEAGAPPLRATGHFSGKTPGTKAQGEHKVVRRAGKVCNTFTTYRLCMCPSFELEHTVVLLLCPHKRRQRKGKWLGKVTVDQIKIFCQKYRFLSADLIHKSVANSCSYIPENKTLRWLKIFYYFNFLFICHLKFMFCLETSLNLK